MTTDTALEATEETAPDPFADTQCSNCEAPVKRRRPSNTGKHFCPRKECQQAKARFYHRRRVEEAAKIERRQAEDHQKQLVAFVGAAVNAARVDCGECGRAGVIPRYAHPVPDWSAACNPPDKLPVSGKPELTTELMLAVYPR